MDRKLYILPFDHRSSFTKLLGLNYENLSASDRAIVVDRKLLIYEGFLRGIELGVPRDAAAILVDEEFGLSIHSLARVAGITRILTTEASEADEFSFAYGNRFGDHLDAVRPEYAKALVRYDRVGDPGKNGHLFENLRTLGAFCAERGYGFLLEVLFPPESSGAYVAASISEFQSQGIEPNVWKIAGFPTDVEIAIPVTQARSGDRDHVGIVILGSGKSETIVESWVSAGSRVPGVVGFAVGRTIFAEPVRAYHVGEISRGEAVERIAHSYFRFSNLFDSAS